MKKKNSIEPAPVPAANYVHLVAEVASAYLSHNQVPQGDVGRVIEIVRGAFADLVGQPHRAVSAPRAAVSVKK